LRQRVGCAQKSGKREKQTKGHQKQEKVKKNIKGGMSKIMTKHGDDGIQKKSEGGH